MLFEIGCRFHDAGQYALLCVGMPEPKHAKLHVPQDKRTESRRVGAAAACIGQHRTTQWPSAVLRAIRLILRGYNTLAWVLECPEVILAHIIAVYAQL